jgi:hypothetical protein
MAWSSLSISHGLSPLLKDKEKLKTRTAKRSGRPTGNSRRERRMMINERKQPRVRERRN